MSTLNHIEASSITIGSAATSNTYGLGTTLSDTDRAIVIPSFQSASNRPDQAHCRVNITNTTTVTATRNASGDSIVHKGYVIEFEDSGCVVQRGDSIGTGTGEGTRDIDINNAFNLAKSFLVMSFEQDGSGYGGDDGVYGYLVDAGSGDLVIRFEDEATGNNKVRDCSWQVCELDDCTVARGVDTGMASGDTTETETITSVDLTKTWMWFAFSHGNGTGTDVGQKLISGGFTDATTIDFARDNSGVAVDSIRYEIVTMSSDWSVQEVTKALASSTATVNATSGGGDFTELTDYTKAFVVPSWMYKGGNGDYSSDDPPGEGWFTAELTSDTNLTITRGRSSGSADFRGFIVEYTASAGLSATVNQSTETDTSQAIGVSPKFRFVNQATEVDASQAITTAKDLSIAQATETDAAQALGSSKDVTLTQCTETDLAQLIELEGDLTAAIELASETDLAQVLGTLKEYTLGQSSETELAQAFGVAKSLAIAQATETDESQAIALSPLFRFVGQASESNSALAISVSSAASAQTAYYVVLKRRRRGGGRRRRHAR